MNQRHSVYGQIHVNTADPLKIVLMLYDGAINALSNAISCIETGDIKKKNLLAGNARDIIEELNNSLDIGQGGEIAEHLRRLYFFMNRHLMKANWQNEAQGFKEVITLLTDLRDAWKSISRQKESLEAESIQKVAGLRI